MKNRINLQLNLFQRPLNLPKQRISKSPRGKNQIHNYSSPASEGVIDFHFGRYPFQNKQIQGDRLLKTTLSCYIEERRLQKLMNVTHPNLINVLKIVKGHPREPVNSSKTAYFSFYYEDIPYSLKRMAAFSESDEKAMAELKNINFSSILKDLTEYLMMQGIFHEIKLDDIGLDQNFNIKIYLSPSIVCGLDKAQSTKQSIIKNNESLTNWWRTTFSLAKSAFQGFTLNIPRVQSIENLDKMAAQMIKSNKSSFIVGESSQIMGEGEEMIENIDQMKISMPEQNFKNLNFSNNIAKCNINNGLTSSIKQDLYNKKMQGLPSANDLKCSQKTFKSQLTRLAQLQQTKMKKIHQEVQKIKKNVKRSSMDYKLRKQSDHIIMEKMKAFNKTVNNSQKQIFESAKLQKTKPNPEFIQMQPHKYNCQSIQQNINCINIYNQSPIAKAGNTHKNILSVPVFSYNIIPANGQINRNTAPHRISQLNIQPTNDRSNTDNGSNASFQIQDHKLVTNSIAFRHSLEPSDDHPLLNIQKVDKGIHANSKQIKVTTKNVTESAGPLQFKNIINKLIKPQFMAKKSNIYEDPHQDESEHQISKQENIIKQSQKIIINKQEKIQSIQRFNEKPKFKPYNGITPIRQNKIIQAQQAADGRNNSINKINNLATQQSQRNLLKKATTHEDSLNSRIKEVVLKTKNAIELLNRVKSNKSINRRNISPS